MQVKVFEVRDRATMFGVMAVSTKPANDAQKRLLRHCGYGQDSGCLIVAHLAGTGKVAVDPYDWGDRTYKIAHHYIEENFDRLQDGDVVDVEFILGETQEPKKPEAGRW